MAALGFLVTLAARAGKEGDVAAFLRSARGMADAEPGTLMWSGFRSGPRSFGIYDLFDTEADRAIHLHGKIRAALSARSDELFSVAPVITPFDVVAAKLPTLGPAT